MKKILKPMPGWKAKFDRTAIPNIPLREKHSDLGRHF